MKYIALVSVFALTACHSPYVIPDTAISGEIQTHKGTVVSVDKDNDFLMEVRGRMLFVDNDDVGYDVEIGDRLIVEGEVDNDIVSGEAPELDAETILSWITSQDKN